MISRARSKWNYPLAFDPPNINDIEKSWHVQYRSGSVDRIEHHQTPELAIAAACHLIDVGHDVFGIGTGPLTDSIDRRQIARIYQLWVEERHSPW